MIIDRFLLFSSILLMACLLGNVQIQDVKADSDISSSSGPNVASNAMEPKADSTLIGREIETKKDSNMIDVLECKDTDIIDALKWIAQKSGLNIVAEQNVQGKVTIHLKTIEVRDALRIILDSNDLAYREDNRTIRVMTAWDFETQYGHRFGEDLQTAIIPLKNARALDLSGVLNQMKTPSGKVIIDEKSNTLILLEAPDQLLAMKKFIQETDIPRKTQVFDLSYAQAEDMAAKINKVLTAHVGKVKFDKPSNEVIVTDTALKIEEIRKIIQAFDQKEPEVLLEAKILQIVLSDEHKMGVDWEAIVSDYQSLSLKNSLNVLSSNDSEKSVRLSMGTISADDYEVLLEALDTVGKTNILSNPRVATLNNQEIKILAASTQPYLTTTTSPSSGSAMTASSVNFVQMGMKLFVTPTIDQNNFITVKIKPVVQTLEAETSVLVKNGGTVVIGGLMKDEKIQSIKKIPVLGDLPFVGFAFRNQDKFIRKTELVIFLTPRIISGDVKTNEENKVK